MAVESAQDRAGFTCLDEFGVEVTYTPNGGSPVTFNAIFDEPDAALNLGIDTPIEGTAPQITVAVENLPAGHSNADTIEVNGTNYRRVEFQPDGTGFAVIRMQEV